MQSLFPPYIMYHANGGAKRRREHAGSVASSAGEMPTVFSDLLAPRESTRRQLIRQEPQIDKDTMLIRTPTKS